jgi:hypothetical protein
MKMVILIGLSLGGFIAGWCIAEIQRSTYSLIDHVPMTNQQKPKKPKLYLV